MDRDFSHNTFSLRKAVQRKEQSQFCWGSNEMILSVANVLWLLGVTWNQ